jgi:hypothetical protein
MDFGWLEMGFYNSLIISFRIRVFFHQNLKLSPSDHQSSADFLISCNFLGIYYISLKISNPYLLKPKTQKNLYIKHKKFMLKYKQLPLFGLLKPGIF